MRKGFKAGVALCAAVMTIAPPAHASVGSWSAAGTLHTDRFGAAAAKLPDGTVLIIAGSDEYGNVLNSTERYYPATNTWGPASILNTARRAESAVTLRDGRVMVTGGESAPLTYLKSVEVYSPAASQWTNAASMNEARSAHASVLLDDGRVLVAGGWDNLNRDDAAEVYDPTRNTWTLTGPMSDVRANPALVKLADGRVLAVGGWEAPTSYLSAGDYLSSAEIYDPATNAWTAVAPLAGGHDDPSAALLPDGRVLVAGGENLENLLPLSLQSYQVFDPDAGAWSAPALMNAPRDGGQVVTLPDGRPMLVGGFDQATSQDERTADIFDPATSTWTLTPPMHTGRAGHIAAVLGDGSVLAAGGFGVSSAERFVLATPTPTPTATPPATATPGPAPAASPTPAAAPTVTARAPGVLGFVAVAKRVKARAGVIAVRLHCAGATPCTGALKLRRGTKTLAKASVTLPAGATRTVKLTLSRADRRRLHGKATHVVLALPGATAKTTLTV